MNPAEKFLLRDRLKEKIPHIGDSILYEVLHELDQMGALKNTLETKNEITTGKPKPGLPETFFMVSPLWSGKVKLLEREGLFAYLDSENQIRIHGKTEKEIMKKVNKYRK